MLLSTKTLPLLPYFKGGMVLIMTLINNIHQMIQELPTEKSIEIA
jgi:hypothetical protein